ncbi:MAG: hypothetical protein OJF49_001854 [Ktedonobacterales bacterium]|nr:MAG: hypothetical protein OJF49_001854 [Ktedonobacterales bacterium]
MMHSYQLLRTSTPSPARAGGLCGGTPYRRGFNRPLRPYDTLARQ